VEAGEKGAMDMVMTMNISSSFDVEQFNMVESVEGSMYVNNQTIPVAMDQIVNWKQGVVTQHSSTAGQDPICKVMKLPPFVTGVRFMKLMGLVMKGMEKGYTCAGTANGMDTYKLDFPPSWLPVPSPVEVHTEIDVDQELLVHRETETEDFDIKGTKGHVESSFVSDSNRAGGPTADDMAVPDSWGPCEEHVLDIDEMLKPFAEDVDRARIVRAVGSFRKLLRAVRFARELAAHSEIVV